MEIQLSENPVTELMKPRDRESGITVAIHHLLSVCNVIMLTGRCLKVAL